MNKLCNTLHMDIVDLIRVIELRRAERNMTQESLAKSAGISRRTLNSFFAGQTDIGLRRLLRIARALDLTVTIAPGKGRPTEADLPAMFRDD
ncbi:MAG: hypothetical protein JWP59_2780 [Massilia sp.]|jgi:transcriptional regulator with XRE-family HTH domain|nr:hypothetical protein [Massilia sp.]